MSIIGSNVLAGASGSGVEAYEIEQSLRFDGGSKLSRTPSSAGTTTTWTLSYWIKIGDLTAEQAILSANPSAGGYTATWFSAGATSRLKINQYNHPTNVYSKCPTPVYRDPSAWFHVVVVFDSTNATADDRVRFYVNGERQTDFSDDGSSVGGTTNPSQNQASGVNHNAVHYIGSQYDGTYAYAKSYLAEMHLLDGTAVTDAEDFGEYDDNGVWRPIEYTGDSYGTNGFYLKFDETATNGIGHDHSGNGNNWTASGFVTSGTGTDVMNDTPTKNFPTLNPLDNLNGRYSNDPTNGNLEVSIPSDSVSKRNFPGFYSTQAIPTAGKFYFEFEPSQEYTTINIVDVDEVGTITSGDHVGQSDKLSFQYFCESGNYRFNGSTTASGLGGFSSGNIYGVAVDLENETFRVYENGIAGSELSISGYLGADARIAPSVDASGSSGTVTMNFGQREFAYPPGTASATDYFNCVTWTGNGSSTSREITGVGFQPDLVWIKGRSVDGSGHRLQDVVRGAGIMIQTTSANGEFDDTSNVGAFTSDGFTLTTTGSSYNQNSATYVAWCWKAGGTASDNTDGNVTSSVSVNQDAGFSVVKYTSSTSTKPLNVGHGLGKKPDFILTKNLDATASWGGYHSSVGATKSMFINSTGSGTVSGDYFNDTEPTSSVFTVFDSNNTHSYGTTNEFIAYCWTEKEGVSKFGSFTGNGSSTGPFVECGFKPRMVIVKRTDSNSNWFMYDTIRGTNNKLYAEDTSNENGEDGGSTSSNTILSLSTGFQMTSGNGSNASGGTYIFMAWAETFSADAAFKPLNTANLPAPEIKDGSEYFETVLYTGDGNSTQEVTTSFEPDLVWNKVRNKGFYPRLFDRLRGTLDKALYPSENFAEDNVTDYGEITATSATSVTVGQGSDSANLINQNNDTFVLWNWLEGASQGFDIISYTGNGVNGRSIAHSLGVVPAFIIVKNRDSAESWAVWHQALDSAIKYLSLNNTNAAASASAIFGGGANEELPDSTNFYVGSNGMVNANGDDYIAYCFAEVEGYSKFGSYTGNGSSTDGPFIYTGFAVSWVMCKRTDSSTAGNWVIWDNERNPYNESAKYLLANTSASEGSSGTQIDLLSNGFKPRSVGGCNTSGASYIFVAFAENPFGGDGVSPATAR